MAAAIEVEQGPAGRPQRSKALGTDVTNLARPVGLDAQIFVTYEALVQIRWEAVELGEVVADVAAEVLSAPDGWRVLLLPTSPFLQVRSDGVAAGLLTLLIVCASPQLLSST